MRLYYFYFLRFGVSTFLLFLPYIIITIIVIATPTTIIIATIIIAAIRVLLYLILP